MVFHIFVILFMITAAAAFLILWYLWVKRRLESSYFLEDEQQTLFPFRYFSWLLIGMIVVTCLIQIHFVRVSSVVHEKLGEITAPPERPTVSPEDLSDLKRIMEGIKREVGALNLSQKTSTIDRLASVKPHREPKGGMPVSRTRPSRREALVALKPSPKPDTGSGFDREAKASSARTAVKPSSAPAQTSSVSRDSSASRSLRTPKPVVADHEKEPKVLSMALNLSGQVTATSLNMRRRPTERGKVIERLESGQVLKVTEKRIVGDRMWFRVVAPSGKAGWVDFRYVKLQARQSSSAGT